MESESVSVLYMIGHALSPEGRKREGNLCTEFKMVIYFVVVVSVIFPYGDDFE